jgi:thioester reductase-like protein
MVRKRQKTILLKDRSEENRLSSAVSDRTEGRSRRSADITRGVSGWPVQGDRKVLGAAGGAGQSMVAGETTDYTAELELDGSFDFSRPLFPDALNPRSVFLTGATGLLGAHLIQELMERTSADVYCLVRGADEADVRRRLADHLRAYSVWREEFASRIHAVAGDVSLPLLGLAPERFVKLAREIGAIYHSAGRLNMALPYAQLKAPNVTGTREVLRLACTEYTRPVHFVSSLAVFFSDRYAGGPLLTESDAPEYHSSLKGGYSKSKWVADQMLTRAGERGLPVTIFRPVRIMGHSRTGFNHDTGDLLPILLRGCLLLGRCPELDITVTMVPVDYVAQAIVSLAGRRESWGRAFHLFNHAPIEWGHLMSILRSHGYRLEVMSWDDWKRELKRRSQDASAPEESRQAFSKLILALTAPHFLFYKRPQMDDSNTREGLRGTGITPRPVDEELISTYISFWQTQGYLPRPEQPARERRP